MDSQRTDTGARCHGCPWALYMGYCPPLVAREIRTYAAGTPRKVHSARRFEGAAAFNRRRTARGSRANTKRCKLHLGRGERERQEYARYPADGAACPTLQVRHQLCFETYRSLTHNGALQPRSRISGAALKRGTASTRAMIATHYETELETLG